ncbi:class I SAM-dependent methyltransferase [Candidatus Gottesmanbacteria bacterium]|nr:class I SAM-dependent methyltransferase [Candidatus Gottesmanbacteria bacterium]
MTFFFQKNGYAIWRCPTCGLGETQLSRPYEAFVKDFYTKDYFTGTAAHGAYSNYAQDKPYITRTMRKFLTTVQRYTSSGRLLDVGCAYGYFVELALAAGFDAYGIDPSAHAVSKAKERFDGRIQQGTVGSLRFSQKPFDVITMLDVVEHLGDPRKDLQAIANLISDNGVVLIATGDTQSLAARALARRWTFYIPPQHLFFFNRKNFTTLLGQSGLEPIAWFKVGKWLSLQYIFHLARTTGESKLAQWVYPLLETLPLGRIPLYLPMRDNMVVIAKKTQ